MSVKDMSVKDMSIKDMVKDNKKVHFKFYRKNILFYETEDKFLFEVPIEDVGDASMLRDDKAMLFMRYIRKQLKANEAGKESLG